MKLSINKQNSKDYKAKDNTSSTVASLLKEKYNIVVNTNEYNVVYNKDLREYSVENKETFEMIVISEEKLEEAKANGQIDIVAEFINKYISSILSETED